jgi:DNA polymerase-3 subunit beta
MKLRANRADLADALGWASQATPKKFLAPVLAGVRITAEAEAVTLSCFSYDTMHTAVVACDVPDAGECLVSAKTLHSILAALKTDSVELAVDGPRLIITSGKSTYRLGVMRLDDYPSLPAFPEAVGKVARDDLADLVSTVEHAAGRDGAVPVLTAIHLEADGLGTLTATTTDRFRIAHDAAPYDGKPFVANVPASTLSAAVKGLSGPVTVGRSDSLLGLSDGARTVTTRLLDDDYPRIAPHLNVTPTLTVRLDADALAASLKRVELVSEPNTPPHLSFTADEVEVAVSGGNDGAEYVACEASDSIEVVVSGRFLADALLAIGGPVVLGFTGPTKPVLITPADDRAVKAVVMPRRSTK